MTFPAHELLKLREIAFAGSRILVASHINPDPDAIGSILAASNLLAQLGAAPVAVVERGFAPRCRSLPGADTIRTVAQLPAETRFDCAFIVDCGSLSRIGDAERFLNSGAFLINVDHHVSNDAFGSVNWVMVESSATCEILYELCRELSLKIDRDLATNLYAGILTDTGRFRFSNTHARTLQIAAELIALGTDPTTITNILYYDLPERDLRSMSRIFGSLELHGGGSVSSMIVRKESLVEDPDSIVDLGLSIRGVEIAALLSETDNDRIRVSLRSKRYVNVSEIAARLGGGGHERAAGFRMQGNLESVRERVVPILVDASRAAAAIADVG